jgi:hypothetical protein
VGSIRFRGGSVHHISGAEDDPMVGVGTSGVFFLRSTPKLTVFIASPAKRFYRRVYQVYSKVRDILGLG